MVIINIYFGSNCLFHQYVSKHGKPSPTMTSLVMRCHSFAISIANRCPFQQNQTFVGLCHVCDFYWPIYLAKGQMQVRNRERLVALLPESETAGKFLFFSAKIYVSCSENQVRAYFIKKQFFSVTAGNFSSAAV